MAFDQATGKLTLENDGGKSNTYAVSLERLNIDGSTNIYSNTTITDGTGVGAVIDVGTTWNGTPPLNVNTERRWCCDPERRAPTSLLLVHFTPT
jgi:hypothetical protein